jgi:hypothetical protein
MHGTQKKMVSIMHGTHKKTVSIMHGTQKKAISISHRTKKNGFNHAWDTHEVCPALQWKQQMVTYDTIKDHTVNLVQKTYKHGNDIAKALLDEANLANVGRGAPVRNKVAVPGGGLNDLQALKLQLEKNGFDINYEEQL